MGYIYKITNHISNKCYIGKTERTIKERWQEHCRHINTYPNLPLYKAMLKYGIENFSIEVLEECNSNDIDDKEIYWINYYNTYNGNGYNCTGGGEGGIKPIPESEILEIAKRYQQGERLDKLCKEYHHRYPKVRDALVMAGIEIKTQAGPDTQKRPVAAINPKTQEVEQIFESITAAGKALHKPGTKPSGVSGHISEVIGKKNIRYGYQWKYWDIENNTFKEY